MRSCWFDGRSSEWKFQQSHQGNSKSRFAMTWISARTQDNFPPTRHDEAFSPSNGPTTSVPLASLNLTFDEDVQFEGIRTVDLCTNSVAGSGAGCPHAEYTSGRFAVHPVTSENVSWRTSGIVLDQELPPNQTVYFLSDARAVLDSSDKTFMGLAGSDFNFAGAEQVTGEASTTTTIAEMSLFVLPVGEGQRICVARIQ